jgi:short subunit dehydrogenase-like uncharacterized protein
LGVSGFGAQAAEHEASGDTITGADDQYPAAEVVTVPRHLKVRNVETLMDISSVIASSMVGALASALGPPLALLVRSPLHRVLDTIIDRLPEGPPPERRSAASLAIVAEAVGSDGRTVTAMLRGTDIYGSTAKICVQAARRLVDDGAPAGVQAPSQAFDPHNMLGFLKEIGFHVAIAEPQTRTAGTS